MVDGVTGWKELVQCCAVEVVKPSPDRAQIPRLLMVGNRVRVKIRVIKKTVMNTSVQVCEKHVIGLLEKL